MSYDTNIPRMVGLSGGLWLGLGLWLLERHQPYCDVLLCGTSKGHDISFGISFGVYD